MLKSTAEGVRMYAEMANTGRNYFRGVSRGLDGENLPPEIDAEGVGGIHYFGNPGKPGEPVHIYLPGLWENGFAWEEFIEHSIENGDSGDRHWAVHLEPENQSPMPYYPPEAAEELDHFVREVDAYVSPSSYVLNCHSGGGLVALEALNKDYDWVDRTEKVVLAACPVNGSSMAFSVDWLRPGSGYLNQLKSVEVPDNVELHSIEGTEDPFYPSNSVHPDGSIKHTVDGGHHLIQEKEGIEKIRQILSS